MNNAIRKIAIYNILKQCCNIIFPLITYPYVSRVLLSDGLGKYSFADSIVSLSMTIAALGINTYGIREGARIRKNANELSKFSAQIFTINMVFTIVVYVILGFMLLTISRFQKNNIVIFILSFNIIFNTLSRDWINQIFEDYRYITIRYIFFQTIALILIFSCINDHGDYIKYTFIMLLANSGGYAISIFYTRKYIPLRLTKELNLKTHLKPMLYLLGIALAVQVYVRSDIVILGFFRSDKEVGIYTVSSKVYIILKTLFNAIISVTIPRLANYCGNGNIDAYNELVTKLRNWLIVLIFPCVIGVFSLSNEILLAIGGREYIAGKLPLQILSISIVFAVFGCYYTNCLLVVRRKDSIFFRATLISAFINVVFNIILVPYIGMKGAAITTLVAELIVLSISIKNSKDVEIIHEKRISYSVAVGCVGVSAVCFFTKILIASILLRVLITILLSIFIYYIINKMMRNPIFFELEAYITNYLKR